MVTGGAESADTITALAGFANMTALSSTGTSKPFDATRDGFVLGEGAGILVLELWDRAVERGATILGEVLGAGSTADAYHITAPSPGGSGAVACIELALADAGLSAGGHPPDQRPRHVDAAERRGRGRGGGQGLRHARAAR